MSFLFSCLIWVHRGSTPGLVQDVDDLAGQALEFVVEVVGEMVDALVRAFDPAADFGEVLGLLAAELVELACGSGAAVSPVPARARAGA